MALCSPYAQFTCGPAEQQNFDALKAALAPELRVWDRRHGSRRACSPTPRRWPCRPSWSSPTMRALSNPSPSTQTERSYPPHLLELMAVEHELKALWSYLLDRPFELHTDKYSVRF